MQVDPSHRRAPAAQPRSGPWPQGRARLALLPLALGLLPAGLQTGCATAAPALSTHTQALRVVAHTPLAAPAPAPGPRHAVMTALAPAGPAPATLLQAEQGDVDAMLRLALMHETGTADVAQDRAEMLRWLALASTLGSGPASYRLFLHYGDQPRGSARAQRFKALAQRQGYYGPVSAQGSR
jgi:hypothetical protein